MRQQMEALVNDLPSQATSGQSNLVVELQNEVQTLRQQNRDLISRLDSRHSNVDVDHTAVNHELKKNPHLNSYVQSLNNTIGKQFSFDNIDKTIFYFFFQRHFVRIKCNLFLKCAS